VYSDPRVVDFIQQHFTPVRAHVKQNPDDYKRLSARFNAQWTPTTLIVDGEGTERHRIEGFLPVDDFLSQLTLGLAKSAFARGNFAEAERLYRGIVEEYLDTDAAPEALYWAGVSKYKATGDGSALGDTGRAFSTRYTDTSWAKKASVWKG
jgi:Thioredoxin-like domain